MWMRMCLQKRIFKCFNMCTNGIYDSNGVRCDNSQVWWILQNPFMQFHVFYRIYDSVELDVCWRTQSNHKCMSIKQSIDVRKPTQPMGWAHGMRQPALKRSLQDPSAATCVKEALQQWPRSTKSAEDSRSKQQKCVSKTREITRIKDIQVKCVSKPVWQTQRTRYLHDIFIEPMWPMGSRWGLWCDYFNVILCQNFHIANSSY